MQRSTLSFSQWKESAAGNLTSTSEEDKAYRATIIEHKSESDENGQHRILISGPGNNKLGVSVRDVTLKEKNPQGKPYGTRRKGEKTEYMFFRAQKDIADKDEKEVYRGNLFFGAVTRLVVTCEEEIVKSQQSADDAGDAAPEEEIS